MGKLSTHVLDLASGRPAAGVAISLARVGTHGDTVLKTAATNQDGRCDGPLLEGDALHTGTYALTFAVGDYFAAQGVMLPEPRFVDQVRIAFGIADPTQSYHVPLLVSPWAYSTYRGS